MKEIKRLVIKLGTSTLTHKTGLINIQRFEKLVRVISDIKNSGIEVIIVSSGAIGMGVGKLKLENRPKDTSTKQAAAAIGQCELMYLYDKHFSEYNHIVSQVLLTKDIVDDELKKQNICNTFNKLLEFSAISIVNENDSIATDEIEFGDNDTLSAIVATLCGADTLVLISDIDGLFDKDPNKHNDAKIIPVVTEITREIEDLCGDTFTNQGTGGMVTKIASAKICFENSISMIIINGNDPNNLYEVIEGKKIGTRFEKEE